MKKTGFLQGIVFLSFAQAMVGVNIVTSKLLLSFIPVLVLLSCFLFFHMLDYRRSERS